ncbi:MAG: transcriptional regulator [Micromonosporaceae bacterium]
MGQVICAYRHHAFHGRVLPQEIVAGWVGVTQAQLSRVESGPPITDLTKLVHWAKTLCIPADLLWFKLPGDDGSQQVAQPFLRESQIGMTSRDRRLPTPDILDPDDIKRRDLLRLMSVAGTLIAASHLEESADWERLNRVADRSGHVDAAAVEEYSTLNNHLWNVFIRARAKQAVLPLVREQLTVLIEGLRYVRQAAVHRRLCAVAADLFQLAGEIYFDGNRYTDAAHCYTLAASAGKESAHFDLWACAMIRHAYVAVYDQHFDAAAPLLESAACLARRGDSSLSTRYWVASVQAQVSAGLGQLTSCRRALDQAAQVDRLGGVVHNGGWLRFDGSRLAEEEGACYVALQRPDLAEPPLRQALSQHLSPRRRGIVLTDLAMAGLQRSDLDQSLEYAAATLDVHHAGGSGVLARRLGLLRPHLAPLLSDPRARELGRLIDGMAERPPTDR